MRVFFQLPVIKEINRKNQSLCFIDYAGNVSALDKLDIHNA